MSKNTIIIIFLCLNLWLINTSDNLALISVMVLTITYFVRYLHIYSVLLTAIIIKIYKLGLIETVSLIQDITDDLKELKEKKKELKIKVLNKLGISKFLL